LESDTHNAEPLVSDTPNAPSTKKMYFDEEYISNLITQLRETGDISCWHKIIEGSIPLMDSIIRDGHYIKYADIHELRSECSIKLWKVIHNFDPKRGKAFTIFSISLKNFLLSYIKRKVSKQRIYTESCKDEFLEEIQGEAYVSYSIPKHFQDRILEIDTRFIEENQRNALKYFIHYFIADGLWESKTKMVYTASSIFKLQIDKSAILYDYALLKLRSELLDLSDIELTDIEILRLNKRWSVIPELAELIGMPSMLKLIKVMGGINLTIPSIRDIQKLEKSKRVLEQSQINDSFYGMKDASKNINADANDELERISTGVVNQEAFSEPLFSAEELQGSFDKESEDEDYED